jgi:hypothetical protein
MADFKLKKGVVNWEATCDNGNPPIVIVGENKSAVKARAKEKCPEGVTLKKVYTEYEFDLEKVMSLLGDFKITKFGG